MINRIGYDQPDFNARICSILTSPQVLPSNGSCQFNETELTDAAIEKIGVKNQVTVFGFACDHTGDLMPLPIWLAHKLTRQLARIRHQKTLDYLMPDGKVQVGVEFRNRRPTRIHSVVVTAEQRQAEKPGAKTVHRDIRRLVIDPVFEAQRLQPDKKTRITVNPDGPYLGGPTSHSGLTGRKNAVDTYGEYSRLSEKALSGKDPMRIDRVGAYAARYAAKNIVAAKLASECEIALSYSIGLTRPVSMQVYTFGTGKLPDSKIADLVREHFDFRLGGILKQFNLRRLPSLHPDGFYQKLATYGHFGRSDLELPWENTDRAADLAGALK
jgi:S-adenosylmethionine synthetase